MPRILRCFDPYAALESLTSLFDAPANHLTRALGPAGARALKDDRDPIGALPRALAAELGTTAHPPDRVHYFHGSRATDLASFVKDGLHPLLSKLDVIWSELAGLAPEISAGDLSRLRKDLTAGSIEPHTYSLRVNGKVDHGPCGELVRDVLLHPDDYHAVNYLDGSEIATDICRAVRERFGIDLTARYRRATTPCIFEFAMPATNGDRALAAAAWYVEAALRGARTSNSNWAYDGRGTPVPATAVVSVLAPDGSVLIGKYASRGRNRNATPRSSI